MKNFRSKPIGWRGESHRHYLAAKGVKTKAEQVSDVLKNSWMDRERVLSEKRKKAAAKEYERMSPADKYHLDALVAERKELEAKYDKAMAEHDELTAEDIEDQISDIEQQEREVGDGFYAKKQMKYGVKESELSGVKGFMVTVSNGPNKLSERPLRNPAGYVFFEDKSSAETYARRKNFELEDDDIQRRAAAELVRRRLEKDKLEAQMASAGYVFFDDKSSNK